MVFMAKLSLEINQLLLSGGQRLYKKNLEPFLKSIEQVISISKPIMISLAFVSAKEMCAYNQRYRHKNKETDVLAFSFPQGVYAGEILLCYPYVKKQAQQKGHGVKKEILFLLAHGLLHVFGYDHQTQKKQQQMQRIQGEILRPLGIDPQW